MSTPGTVDANGLLWKSTAVGKLMEPGEEQSNCWAAINTACTKYVSQPCVGERELIEKTTVDGFEKVVLGEYSFITYGEYLARINNLGSGLATLPELGPGVLDTLGHIPVLLLRENLVDCRHAVLIPGAFHPYNHIWASLYWS